MFCRWGAISFNGGTVKQGGFIFVVGLSFGLSLFSLKAQQSGSPLPEPTADAIARAIEAERKRREAELQNPLTQISIQRAQQIQIALREVNLKSQETRILIENNIESAQKAATPELAAKFYEDIISCGIKCNLAVTYGEKNTDEIKFKFLDYPNITDIKLRTKEDVKQLKDEEINKLFYQSNKYLIHKGKFYPSQAALEASVSCEEMSASVIHEIPDKPIFFKDLDHVRILKKKLDLRPPIS